MALPPPAPSARSPAAPRTTAPYGSWPSDASAARVAAGSLRLGQIALRGDTVCWTEGRPTEQGRQVLMAAAADGQRRELTPAPWNVRTTAHEYGGGAFALCGADALCFSHAADHNLHRLGADGVVRALTATTDMRYADATFDAGRQRLVAVREDHGKAGVEPVNTLVGIDWASGEQRVLAQGHDFYAGPCLSPDGQQLAWLSWDHPRMPWDGTELWVATLDAEGRPGTPRRVAGGTDESVFQPTWSPRGELHFVSDRSGWWNLCRERDGRIEPLCPREAEFGEPQWTFGMSTYGFDGRGRIVCTFIDAGRYRLGVLEPDGGALRPIETPCVAIRDLRVGDDFIAYMGGTTDAPEALIRQSIDGDRLDVLRRSGEMPAHAADVSRAEAITFPTDGGASAHGYFYRPTHRSVDGPPGERPPLIVMSHGGPTGATTPAFRWPVQFWTQRGFAVVDINYGGSTGHGRAYRERLKGRWGVVDVADAVQGARFLVERGDVDGARLLIRGSSAGGYTTLAALTFAAAGFAAGASHYGIGDLEALARDTHKFESRYLDGLVGPYPARRDLYRARSPIHHLERLASALILFQGSEDRVVPPAQAEAMYAAVRARGLPVAYLLFEQEQHGFRRAENIARALEAELCFYGRVLGFDPADRIAPVDIANLAPPAGKEGGATAGGATPEGG